MDERINKLPQWAQDEFRRVTRRANEAERLLSEHLAKGNFVQGDYNNCRVPGKLVLHSSESAVEYGAIRVTFDSVSEIEVTTTGRLTIETRAGNVIAVRTEGSL